MSNKTSGQEAKRDAFQKKVLLAGILVIGINLRPALAAVGPLVAAIRESTGLSNSMLGLLTTLPLLAFGVISMLTPLVTRRFGIEKTLFWALVGLTAGIALRILESPLALFGGTLILGIAIALGNVLLPGIVKRDFPHKSGMVTSLYSGMMGLGASLAAGLSVPLAEQAGLGWRWSLASWGLLSMIGVLVWFPQLKFQSKKKGSPRSFRKAMKALAQSASAWQVALFMGLQSLAFYVILAWLPEILQSRGMSASNAGWMLSLSQVMGVGGTLVIPWWAGRKNDQRGIVWLLIIMEAISLIGLVLPGTDWVPVWASLIGFALGGSFGLALLFIVLRSKDSDNATELSGMSQSAGYLIASIGPFLFGALYDLAGNWYVPFVLLGVVLVIKLVMGLGAGKPDNS